MATLKPALSVYYQYIITSIISAVDTQSKMLVMERTHVRKNSVKSHKVVLREAYNYS